MLTRLIQLSLNNRALVLVLALLVAAYGVWTAANLPTDVLPGLNRPTVTIMTESPGLAPEEVETLVTFPIEAAVNGAPGVERVRSQSGQGLSLVYVEFGWETEPRFNRQVVQERMASLTGQVPRGVTPRMGAMTSIMGEIMLVGLSADPKRAAGAAPTPMELRTLAEWAVRPALLSVRGVSSVTTMGGELRQFHVRVDAAALAALRLTLADVERALADGDAPGPGGVLPPAGAPGTGLTVRSLGRFESSEDVHATPVTVRTTGDGRRVPVTVGDVAEVVESGPVTRVGVAAMDDLPAVVLAVQKQPDADTRELTGRIERALADLRPSLPKGVLLRDDLFRQAGFIQAAVDNVKLALRDGAVFVAVVLVLFLLNVRTTLITLTAIPLSVLTTAIVFAALGMSVNTMTLGGIAVAVGELVDDAVVDVENVHRRLKENRLRATQRPVLAVVLGASSEVRSSIVVGTAIVLMVFLPLFALTGVEGRLFSPLAVAYIVSIASSMLVSLTVTPVLCSYLLSGGWGRREEAPRGTRAVAGWRRVLARVVPPEGDGPVLRGCKALARRAYALTLPRPMATIGACALLVGVGGWMVSRLGVEFLPPFNEGSATINVVATPGITLEESAKLGVMARRELLAIPEVRSLALRTGRAEGDEHAQGVHSNEFEVELWTRDDARRAPRPVSAGGRACPEKVRGKDEVFAEARARLSTLPGVNVSIGQPIGHRIEHLLTGVEAQVVVKITGDDLNTLRNLADAVRARLEPVPGVVDLAVERQTLVPQVHVRVRRDHAAAWGFSAAEVAYAVEVATAGKGVAKVTEGVRTFDVVLTVAGGPPDPTALADLPLVSSSGAVARLGDVADVLLSQGQSEVRREDLRRRIAVTFNVAGRDTGSVVADARAALGAASFGQGGLALPAGYTLTFGGQFEGQRRATILLATLGAGALLGMFFLLLSVYRSAAVAAQVMLNIPFAFIGAAASLYFTGTEFSVASMVGFISLTGIAARNGVLMVSHYLHLVTHEGVPFGPEMVVRASQERVAPVLMTALTSGLALIPLALSRGEPGREVLHPVALVVLGGLFTSTLLDFFVTPTVFLRFGRRACAAAAQAHASAPSPSIQTGGTP
jgi:CzcA family heavy metal efflux pump